MGIEVFIDPAISNGRVSCNILCTPICSELLSYSAPFDCVSGSRKPEYLDMEHTQHPGAVRFNPASR